MFATWVKLQDSIWQLRSRVFNGEEGQGITEYVLILALVVIALAFAANFLGLGTVLGNAIDAVEAQVSSAAGGG